MWMADNPRYSPYYYNYYLLSYYIVVVRELGIDCLTGETSALSSEDKPLVRALRGETVTPSPVWLMRQAGRYLPEYRKVRAQAGGFLDLCFAPELAAEVTIQPVRRFGLDAAILFSDILLVPLALGQDLDFRENEGPVLTPVRTRKDLAALSNHGLRTTLAPVYKTIRRVRRELPDQTALIGFAGAPWTIATYMVEGGTSRDFAHAKGWAARAPDEFAALMDMLVDSISDHLIAQIDAGVEVVQIFDTWCSAVPQGMFRRLCLDPVRAIGARVKQAHGTVPVIAFPRGAGVRYGDFARAPEIDAVGIDSSVPLDWARAELQPHATVQGSLDPILLLEGGAAMETAAAEILDALAGGRFVFNLGHGVVPQTPPEHVAALVKLVHGGR